MHGLINRALQGFVEVNYGRDTWLEVVSQADLPFEDFEAMLSYPDAHTMQCFGATTEILHRSPNAVLEDLGTFLVTHPPFDPVRRLLRFGGDSFAEFLLSLDEIGDRGRMVMPELDMPEIRVTLADPQTFQVTSRWKLPGIAPILLGALRAMADDYGTLAIVSLEGARDGWETLHVVLHDTEHAEGRSFQLSEVRA